MRWHREQYVERMTFGRAERPMFVELFGPLVGLEDEWQSQGASEEEISLAAFDFDYVPWQHCGARFGVFGGPEPRLIEDTPTHRIERDSLGRTLKVDKRTATVPLPMDFPVKSMDDWRNVKPLFAFREERIDRDAVEAARRARQRGTLIVAEIPGGFDMARELMGEVVACTAYYDQPELMHDVLQTLADTSINVLQRVTEKLTIDQLSVHEDLAGKSGPLVGPKQFREFISPYYAAVWDVVHGRGTRLFDVDSDGDVNPLLDAMLEAGVNSMHPFEPAAGMDIVRVRERYGNRLAIRGGIDKFVLQRGRETIRRELEYKFQPQLRDSGTAFGLDHRIPNGTPLEAYRDYVDTAREMLGLPPRDGTSRGWARMAF